MSSTVTVLCSKVCNGPVANVRASTVTDIVTATSERLARVIVIVTGVPTAGVVVVVTVRVGVNTAPLIVCGNTVVKLSVTGFAERCALPVLIYKVCALRPGVTALKSPTKTAFSLSVTKPFWLSKFAITVTTDGTALPD